MMKEGLFVAALIGFAVSNYLRIITTARVLLISSIFACAGKAASAEKLKPNVIIINTDDLGYGDVGCYGATKVATPHIDRLAKEGLLFTDAHSPSAVCSPSRYGLLTGEYPFRRDFWFPVFLRQSLTIDTNKMTIAKMMKAAGYATACVGKWHLGFQSEEPLDWNKELKPGPLELGFDYYFGVPVLNSHPPFVYVENHRVVGFDPEDPFKYGEHAETRWFSEKFELDAIGGAKAAHNLYDDRAVGTTLKDKAIKWIRNHSNEPFFLYMATTANHHPFTPAPRFIGTSEAGRYGDFIQELDWIVGEVCKALDEEGLAENTLLIFTSDNGAMINQGGQDAWRAGHHMNGDLLGFKFGAWEGGHRIPFIVRWPGKVEPDSKSDQLISHVDLLATLAAMVDVPLRDGEGPDSYNILPAFLGTAKGPIRDQLIISPARETHLTLRKGKWVYIDAQDEGGFLAKNIGDHTLGGAAAHKLTHQQNSDIENGEIKENAPPGQLYDLETDLSQKVNLYNTYPEKVAELKALLELIKGSEQTVHRTK